MKHYRATNHLLLIVVALLCLPVFSSSVQACQCREYFPPICSRFGRSDAVFVGQVVSIKPLKNKWDNTYTYVVADFVVQEAFRGISGRKVGVAVATGMCEPKFKKGKKYLVYATLDDETNQLFTGMCTGTGLADDLDEAVKELRKLSQGQSEESISGRIVSRRYSGLPALKIEATKAGETFTTVTDKYGYFSLPAVRSGSFEVRVSVPYVAQLVDASDDDVYVRSTRTESFSTFTYDVTLQNSQCSYLEIDLEGTDHRATATVSGNALDAAGKAVDTGWIYLINTVETAIEYGALLKKDGSFTFEQILPGEYYLALNPNNEEPGRADAPYARAFYPATADKNEAKKIVVTDRATIENLTLRVGNRMSERRATGKVVWNGGRSIEDAYLAVYSGDKYAVRHEINDDGTFDVILYGDFDYSIEARDDHGEIDGRSQRIRVPPENATGLKLIIQRVRKNR